MSQASRTSEATRLSDSLLPIQVVVLVALTLAYFPASPAGYRKLRRFSRKYSDPVWAIEGAYGLGAPLAALLIDNKVTVWDVPAKPAARGRLLSTGHGRKSDQDDALSVAVVAATSRNLRPVQPEISSVELKVLTEYRDDLVATRAQTVNRLHAIMNLLNLAGAPRQLSADAAARLLRRAHPDDDLALTRRMIAVDLIAEIRHLDKRIAAVTERITTQTAATGTTLTVICGIGSLTAARILARTGTISRFPTPNRFAASQGCTSRSVLRRCHPSQALRWPGQTVELCAPCHVNYAYHRDDR